MLKIKNHIQRSDVMLWEYEHEMWKHDQNNMAPTSAVFVGLKETAFKI
jgi:hypothetical protein